MEQLAGLGIDRSALIAALQAQNAVRPAGVIQTGDEKLSLRVSGAFGSEQDILNVNFVANGRMIRLRDIAAGPPRLSPTRRSRCSASTASRRSASPSPCATAATSWRSGDNIEQGRCSAITADLPLGIEPILVADQPVGRSRHRRVHGLAVAGIAIIMAVSFISLGVRPGSSWRCRSR